MGFYLTVLLVLCFSGQITGWFYKTAPRKKCYENLGCFSNAFPYANTKFLLPHSPEMIGTKFYLATRNTTDAPEELVVTDDHQNCSWKSFCEGTKRVILLIHGYMYHIADGWADTMRNELLKQGDYNVIFVDWQKGAKEINYYQSAANTRVVGAQIAQLLKVLKNVYNIDPSNVHIIGHSLGAHIAGYAGENMENIGRITGLDPAGPAFDQEDPRVRLDATDANFVDVLHTDGEPFFKLGFGVSIPCGTVDFYPNEGKDQPGCPNFYMHYVNSVLGGKDLKAVAMNMACSHLRALDFFIESINSKCHFTAFPSQQNNTCGPTGCGVMGFHTSPSLSSGKYFLETKSTAPFCIA